jgi:hypothetical protein
MQEVQHPGTLEHTDLGIQGSKHVTKNPAIQEYIHSEKRTQAFGHQNRSTYRNPRISVR